MLEKKEPNNKLVIKNLTFDLWVSGNVEVLPIKMNESLTLKYNARQDLIANISDIILLKPLMQHDGIFFADVWSKRCWVISGGSAEPQT